VTQPGETVGLNAGAPLPQGWYAINTVDWGCRNTNPQHTCTGLTIPVIAWSTPWTLFGARVQLLAAWPAVEVGVQRNLSVNPDLNLPGTCVDLPQPDGPIRHSSSPPCATQHLSVVSPMASMLRSARWPVLGSRVPCRSRRPLHCGDRRYTQRSLRAANPSAAARRPPVETALRCRLR
jgi:hypothetical protein